MLFEKHLQHVMRWIREQPNVQVTYIQYSEMLANPEPHIQQVNQFLGGQLDTEAMIAIVDPALYRNRQTEK